MKRAILFLAGPCLICLASTVWAQELERTLIHVQDSNGTIIRQVHDGTGAVYGRYLNQDGTVTTGIANATQTYAVESMPVSSAAPAIGISSAQFVSLLAEQEGEWVGIFRSNGTRKCYPIFQSVGFDNTGLLNTSTRVLGPSDELVSLRTVIQKFDFASSSLAERNVIDNSVKNHKFGAYFDYMLEPSVVIYRTTDVAGMKVKEVLSGGSETRSHSAYLVEFDQFGNERFVEELFDISFEKITASGPSTHIKVNSTPEGATVYVEDVYRGETEYLGFTREERLNIRVEKDGFQSVSKAETIALGIVNSFLYKLEKAKPAE